jgi:DNA-binding MarR family transcriptional regulator
MEQLLSHASNRVSVEDCAHEVLDSVTPVNRFIRRQMCACHKDLSLPQFRTLVCVNQEPEASLSTVAHFLGSSMPTASRIVGGLVQKGLLKRRGCADRRQVSLDLTAQGRALMEKAWSGAQAALEAQIAAFSPRERAVVSSAMTLLRGVFGSAGLGGGPGPRSSGSREGKAVNGS